MAECFYYKGNEKFETMSELIDAFYKDNKQLVNAAIYSSDEIQQSTIKLLRGLPGINNYEEAKGTVVTKFISEPNPGFFARVGVTVGSEGILTPEYREESRIYHYILDNLHTLDSVPDDVVVAGLPYTQSKLNDLRTHTDLTNLSDNKLILLLSKIEGTMEFENKTKDFGNLLHKIISLKVKDSPYSRILDSFLDDPTNAEIIGNYSKQEWINKINEITDKVIDNVKAIGIPLTEMAFSTDLIKGRLDLIAVDKQGTAHIFEIKISNTEYEHWDSAKALTLDWQLALYRQLLGQHINVDQTQLYVIPIWINNLGNPNVINMHPFSNRNTIKGSSLNTVGGITEKANKILPRKVVTAYDPERTEKLKDKLNGLLEGYEIQTDIEDYSVDKIMANARKRYDKEKVWKKYNNYENIEGLTKGYMEANSEEEFRGMIEKYVAHVKLQVNRNVSILKDAIISAIKTNQPIKTNSYDTSKDSAINHLLMEFLNDDWEVVSQIPEATAMGLVILKNRFTGNINIISLSINQFYAQSKIKGTEDKSYGDLEYYKTMLFVNEFRNELFPGNQGKLGQIVIFNPKIYQSYYRNVFDKYKEFKTLMYSKGMEKDLKLKESDVPGIEDIAMYTLDTNLRKFNGSEQEKSDIERIFIPMRDTNLDLVDLNTLLDIQKAFFDTYPDYRVLKPQINFSDNKEVLLALLQTAIITKGQIKPEGDFQDLSKFSLGFSDFFSLVKSLYTDNQALYNKEGKRIQGLVQGLVWTTPDWVASKDLKNINNMMSRGNQHTGEKMVKASELIRPNTLEYYKEINFSRLSRNWLGESESKHEPLWAHKDNKVADEFKTKNPYLFDKDNVLSDPQRKYLQKMLLIINSFKLGITDADAAKIDASSLESISQNAKIKKALDDGTYFDMPVIRRDEASRHKGLFENPGKLANKLAHYGDELKNSLDNRELLKSDLDSAQMQQMGFYEMYDIYGKQTPESKSKMIEEHGVDYFEFNLDTIAHKVAFNKIRKSIFDKILPVINAYIWWIKLEAGKEGKDISKQLEYIANQLKLSVYDDPIIDEEFSDLTKVESVIKKFSTAAMLAFKPTALVKEMTVGLFKGISIASTQIYGKDQFGIKDLAAAYKKLMTIDNKFSNEFNLIDNLNHFYMFANMDVNSMSKKLQTDRHGLMKGTGRYMYMCNTIPDYYNRLSIFMAKMIHDGSYDAHTMENGIFKYDPKKDLRFSYYLENRHKNVDDKGRYIPSKTDRKYNEQRQKYLLLMDQLQKEYEGEKVYTENDLIDKAYSEIERKSLKSFSDMCYGYYEKDAQSQANNTWWGMTWLQFMQFWPGRMKQWLAFPTKESPMGRVEQEFETDENGNKVLQWRKPILDENEEYVFDEAGKIQFETTSEDTGDPALKWVGTPYEGLMYSVLATLRDVTKLDFKNIKEHEDRNRRFMFAITDAILIFILLGIAKAMWDAIIAENGTEGLSGSAIQFGATVNKKVLNEYNVWQSTLGAINTEPVFLSWGKKLGGDIGSMINGDKDIIDVMSRNVGAAEIFK